VVGGGAAGFYGALHAATRIPGMSILILEKTSRLLTKVKISGGGRCNVTHDCENPFALARHYPRGARALKKMFKVHNMTHVRAWFGEKGVTLKTESDGRMFPNTDQSQTIIDCFMRETMRLNIEIQLNKGVRNIAATTDGYSLSADDGKNLRCKRVLIATGGNKNLSAYAWLSDLGHSIETPKPSLFTFNDRESSFSDLMGVSVPNAQIRIVSTSFVDEGPLLITHWGLSGPAVIRLSAWAANYLYDINYQFNILVSWIGPADEDQVRTTLSQHREQLKQKVRGHSTFGLPLRLWQRLCDHAGIAEHRTWQELSKRDANRLVEALIRSHFRIEGKTTFKEEFVTSGGVPLTEVDLATMESKMSKGVYFAGEVLDIDGETGGFNFQAAWTTAFIAAQAIADSTSRQVGFSSWSTTPDSSTDNVIEAP
jgi:predicted Rossmann fold flavoprotein